MYAHVSGGAACLSSPILGACIVGVCVLHCTGSPHNRNTMSLCWECTLWFSGTTLLLLLCTVSRQCVAVFFCALLLFTVSRLSHYSSSFLLFVTPIRSIYAMCTWWLFYTFCIVVTDVYYYCLCQFLPCWKGCGGPELGWVSVCHSVGRVLVGAGWDGLLWLVGF